MTTRRFNRFADWCRHQDDLSPEARHTVEVLLELAGTSDGDEAERILLSRTELYLSDNQISDITPLSGLTNLTLLLLHHNQISDITPLSGLMNLTVLSLDGNEIRDITPLSNLTNLTTLGLSSNEISDITSLSGLTNLTGLELYNNQISDITPLSSLTHLTTLGLSSNEISNIKLLSGLTHLTSLELDGNEISDITPLSSLTNLTSVNLQNNPISDITPLSGLTNLIELHLDYEQISDITLLSGLTSLTRLYLKNNQISDITLLSTLTNLTHLYLDANKIRDITPLSGLTHLIVLYLDNNQISDITPLSTLTNLICLHLADNQISDITPLSGLTELDSLHLNSNQISEIMPLSGLMNLKQLHLNNNQISNITPLSGLTELDYLDLNNNQISDITPLSNLTELVYLYLDNNPIASLMLLQALQQQWRNLSTEPIARQPAIVAVKSAYTSIGFAEPEIIFVSSPYAALVSLGGCETLGEPLAGMLYDAAKKPQSQALWYWLRDQMAFQIGWEVEGQLCQQLRDDNIERKNDITPEDLVELISITEFCISEFGCVLEDKEQEALWCLKQLFLSCSWIFPYENVCTVCDRPRILSFDDQEHLHAEGVPAVQFADGWSIYAYHGVKLPEKYGKVNPNQWQSQWLVSEENAELRRALIQGIGYDRIVEELQAIELDSWQEYTLIQIDSDVDLEPIYLLKMTCPSTGYIHTLRVPPYINSAREAIAWVNWGVDPEEFVVQT